MAEKPKYEELAKRVKKLEKTELGNKAAVNGENRSRDKSKSERNPKINIPVIDLASLINVENIQSIMDDFYELTHMVTAVLDLNGKVMESTGWQDICTKFHRVHPETSRNCTESDLFLAKNLKPGEYIDYKCMNGLWDVVTPLYVGDKHLGNIYTGQFFYDDEEVDEEFFIKQAERYGFDKASYMDAFRLIPRYNRETIDHLMSFLVKFTTYVSSISLMNIQLEKEIHERKQVEDALKKNEEYMRTLIQTLPDLIWLKDQEGVYRFCNSRFENFFGAREKDIVGKTDYDFLDKELADFFRGKDKIAIANKKPTTNEEEVLFANDGHREILETIKTPMYSHDGRLTGVLGIGRDITGRKQAENALQESEKRFRGIIDSTEAGYFFINQDGFFQFVNEAWLKMHRYSSPDQVIGRHFSLTQIDMDKDSANIIIKKIINGEAVTSGEFTRRCKDGSIGYHTFTVKPVVQGGEIIGLEGFLIDITDKKKLENQLHQTQKMESIGRLAGGVAHDFNNMLSIILGNTEIAMEDIDPASPLTANLKEIHKAAENSANLTRQLLAFARKQTIAPRVVDLNNILKEMLKMLNRLIGEDIDLVWLPSEKLWPVKIDPSQVDQILVNLCVNARDAIRGVGKVVIETKNISMNDDYCLSHAGFIPGDYIMLSVNDNGCGMDKKALDNLFEPFFTTKEVGQGSGLGLATVYGIVKQNGGFINVYSEPGKGTVFKIYLPRHKEIPPLKQEKDAVKTVQSGNETILLVEDEKAILKMTIMMLERLGYKVLAASTPGHAIRIVQEADREIDLLMTDVVMPEMNGKELSNKMMEIYPDLKCLFMSGYTADVIAHNGMLDEGVPFISKPFSKQELSIKLREILNGRKTR